MGAEDLHGVVEKAVNSGDVDALVASYESDACLLGPAEEQLVGLDVRHRLTDRRRQVVRRAATRS